MANTARPTWIHSGSVTYLLIRGPPLVRVSGLAHDACKVEVLARNCISPQVQDFMLGSYTNCAQIMYDHLLDTVVDRSRYLLWLSKDPGGT